MNTYLHVDSYFFFWYERLQHAYLCFYRCPTYTALPSECHMVTLPGQCCQEPCCSFPTQTTMAVPLFHTVAPSISGCNYAIPNCDSYGRPSCVAPYEAWAQQNCRAYCILCSEYLNSLLHICTRVRPV
jgi:hypothetical protein